MFNSEPSMSGREVISHLALIKKLQRYISLRFKYHPKRCGHVICAPCFTPEKCALTPLTIR